jgi:hypothetical protein
MTGVQRYRKCGGLGQRWYSSVYGKRPAAAPCASTSSHANVRSSSPCCIACSRAGPIGRRTAAPGLPIDGVEGLDLHHLYRAMAWLGEELPGEHLPRAHIGMVAPFLRALGGNTLMIQGQSLLRRAMRNRPIWRERPLHC